jgi:serine/threonine protein phosphatase PrpC
MAKTATPNPSKQGTAPDAEADVQLTAEPRPFAMQSHRGRVRRENQDACAALPEHGAFVVCDGVGGAAAGEVASRLASEAFLDALSRIPSVSGSPPRASEDPHAPLHPELRLRAAVKSANEAVFRYSRRARHRNGMGTTLVAALWDASGSDTLWVANVGDSRCYRLRDGALEVLTEDHSLVEEQVRAGILSRVQADASPIRNIITRAIGSSAQIEADIASHPVQSGDIYLLTSDGLTRELEDGEIAEVLLQSLADGGEAALDTACLALIDLANSCGGRDNITVLLIACP